jgi:glucose-1-phosphate thymidylyltransferase
VKGIVLAGGVGSRLSPITLSVSKQLLPVFDKPLIYYPISTLMLAGIREQLIITTPRDVDSFVRLLGDGSHLGMSFQYLTQETPRGIADAFLLGRTFVADSEVCLALGDNLLHGSGLGTQLSKLRNINGAHIFAYKVADPHHYGVVEFDEEYRAVSIEEKPHSPRSGYAVPGLYFYENDVLEVAKLLKPSNRGELEITDVNKVYLAQKRLTVELLPRGTAWLDTGDAGNLLAAGTYVKIIEERQGYKIACLEEIAWRNKWINDNQLIESTKRNGNNQYNVYIKSLLT